MALMWWADVGLDASSVVFPSGPPQDAMLAEAVANYRASALASLEQLRRNNTPAPDIRPAPEDVVHDPEFGVLFLGPTTMQEKLALEALASCLPEFCNQLRQVSQQIQSGDRDPVLRTRREQLQAQIDTAVTNVARKAMHKRTRQALNGDSDKVSPTSESEDRPCRDRIPVNGRSAQRSHAQDRDRLPSGRQPSAS